MPRREAARPRCCRGARDRGSRAQHGRTAAGRPCRALRPRDGGRARTRLRGLHPSALHRDRPREPDDLPLGRCRRRARHDDPRPRRAACAHGRGARGDPRERSVRRRRGRGCLQRAARLPSGRRRDPLHCERDGEPPRAQDRAQDPPDQRGRVCLRRLRREEGDGSPQDRERIAACRCARAPAQGRGSVGRQLPRDDRDGTARCRLGRAAEAAAPRLPRRRAHEPPAARERRGRLRGRPHRRAHRGRRKGGGREDGLSGFARPASANRR